jgi:single-strand DNA-binding protein
MSNQITVSGRCWEPKTQYTPKGVCITEFSVSVYDGKDKTTQKSKYFNVNCKAFNDLAENIANSINKGDELIVVGRQTVESWEKDGVKHFKNVLIIDEIGKSISRFPGQGATKDNSRPASGYDVSSFGTEVFPEEEIPF